MGAARRQRGVMATDAEWERVSILEERRLREAGAGATGEAACDAVDAWIDAEGMTERLTDPGVANRWKAAGGRALVRAGPRHRAGAVHGRRDRDVTGQAPVPSRKDAART